MNVTVRKLTDRELMLDACESTFAGKSNQSLLSMYKSEHSPSRTQLFWIKLEDIPLYVASHLVRHHLGVEKFQLTHRTDRNGGGDSSTKEILDDVVSAIDSGAYDREDLLPYVISRVNEIDESGGRMTPTNLSLMINAQSLIDMAKLRLCKQASKHTREVFTEIKAKIFEVDSDLAQMMVPKCIYRNGLCGEPKPCGYNKSGAFSIDLVSYAKCFFDKQFPDTVFL